MKKFIKNISLYFIGLVLFWLVFVSFGFFAISNNKKFFQIDSTINKIIVGDSHFEFAINDSLMPNSLNLSHSADNYYYTYLKLRKTLKYNKNIDTVFVSYGFHNLSKGVDKSWLYNPIHFAYRYDSYIYLLEKEDFNQLFIFFIKMPLAFIDVNVSLPLSFFKNRNIKNIEDLNIGKFIYTKESSIDEVDKEVEIDFSKKQLTNFVPSEKQKEYLTKIADLCTEYNVELILVNTPVHKVYYDNLSEIIKNTYFDFFDEKLCKYTLLDYSKYYLPDSCFKDCDHLNAYGAKIITTKILSDLHTRE